MPRGIGMQNLLGCPGRLHSQGGVLPPGMRGMVSRGLRGAGT